MSPESHRGPSPARLAPAEPPDPERLTEDVRRILGPGPAGVLDEEARILEEAHHLLHQALHDQ